MKTARNGQRRGFTLIELILVVLVVGFVAFMLMPMCVFDRPREKARRVNCAGNLKQLGTAVAFYLDEYDDRVPPYFWGAGSWHGYYLAGYLGAQPYNATTNPTFADVLICPSDGSPFTSIYEPSYGYTYQTMNTLAAGQPPFTHMVNEFAHPSETMMFADSGHQPEDGYAAYILLYGYAQRDVYPRHGNGANVTWVDLHVSGVSNVSTLNSTVSYWRRK